MERNLSDSEEAGSAAALSEQQASSSRHRSHNRSTPHRHHRSSQNHYTRLGNHNSSSSSSLISINSNRNVSHNQDINHNYLHGTSVGSFQSTNSSLIFSPSSSLPASLQLGPAGSLGTSGFSQNSVSQQVFYLTPNVQRTADQLTEEEQIKLLKRMTLIQQLPSGFYDENKKNKE